MQRAYFKCYKRLINKQFLQVSGLCGLLFLSYLPKYFTKIYSAHYADAVLMTFQGIPTWRPEINSLRADVSYFLCFTRKRDCQIGHVCTQARNQRKHLELTFAMGAITFLS